LVTKGGALQRQRHLPHLNARLEAKSVMLILTSEANYTGLVKTSDSVVGVTVAKAEDRGTWSVPEAALIGIIAFCFILILPFLSLRPIHDHGFFSSRFQEREVTTLISLAGTTLILAPVILLIIKKRHLGGWWKSIEWNSGRYIWESAISGAVLAVVWSLCLKYLRGTAGSFRDTHLALTVILAVTTEVLASAAVGEMYFRGILFVALAKRFGATVSVLVTTVAFTFVHLGHMFYVLPVAVTLGVWRLKTKSVASCFALHASYNLFILIYLLVRGKAS
jgi:membrane protease YdiL (CAAX protease family)